MVLGLAKNEYKTKAKLLYFNLILEGHEKLIVSDGGDCYYSNRENI